MKKLIFSILSIVFFISSFGSYKEIDSLAEKILTGYRTSMIESPSENVYLHLNNRIFSQGEDIWFKAYLTSGSLNIPSKLSKVLYVDLYDESNQIIDSKTVKIKDGVGNGDFSLPRFISQGKYRIVAYTNWMKNFGEELFYQQEINVLDPYIINFRPIISIDEEELEESSIYDINYTLPETGEYVNKEVRFSLISLNDTIEKVAKVSAENSLNIKIEKELNKKYFFLRTELFENDESTLTKDVKLPFSNKDISLKFMPESGNLIDGVTSKIAFKANFPNGLDAEIVGYIEDDIGEKILEFETLVNGMGLMEFTGSSNRTYKAYYKIKGSDKYESIPFISVEEFGITLELDAFSEKFINVIIREKNLLGNIGGGNQVLLVVNSLNYPAYIIKVDILNGIAGVRIPRSNLLFGFNEVSILLEDGTKVLGRSFFVHKEETFKSFVINSENVKFGAKNKSTIKIDANQIGLELDSASFSVSVVDGSFESSFNDLNINSQILLKSNIRGPVNNISFYFKDDKLDTKKALDLLLMTQAWSRYDLKDLLSIDFKQQFKYYVEKGLSIEGVVSEIYETKKGLSGGKISAILRQDEDVDIFNLEYDESGKFKFINLDFTDTATLVLEADDLRKGENVNIDFVYNKYQLKTYSTLPFFLDVKTYSNYVFLNGSYGDINDEITLEEVEINSRKINPLNEIRRIYGKKGDYTLSVDNVSGFELYPSIIDIIRGRVAGVRVVDNASTLEGNGYISIRGARGINSGPYQALILIDGVPSDLATLRYISPRDVAAIDVFKNAASLTAFGARGGGGVVAVYTKIGTGEVAESLGVVKVKIGGYSLKREFYQPDYSDQDNKDYADYRNTLYWNPNFRFDSKGYGELNYVCNDFSDNLLLTIEGFDNNGNLIHFKKMISKDELN